MIKPGTPCVITYCVITYACKERSEYVGRFCTVVERIPADLLGHDNFIDIGGEIMKGADSCLMPVCDGQEKTIAKKKETA